MTVAARYPEPSPSEPGSFVTQAGSPRTGRRWPATVGPSGIGKLRSVDVTGELRSGVAAVADWLFRNRRTGRITIAQAPNAPLLVFLVAAGSVGCSARGSTGTVIDVVGSIALIAWAVDEIVRGVNPWRRLLGGAVLVGVTVGAVVH